jgi:hypothetical protein
MGPGLTYQNDKIRKQLPCCRLTLKRAKNSSQAVAGCSDGKLTQPKPRLKNEPAAAGRLTTFSGTLGDGVNRTYASDEVNSIVIALGIVNGTK